jgi:amino acid permease
MNKFGESRKITNLDEDVNAVASIKMRQSVKIDKLGTFAAAASIFKAFVGLGVLFLPYQFWETGIVAMPLIMMGSLCLTLYCTTLLCECADDVGNSFSEIAEAAYGPKMKTLTKILIVCS